MESESRRPGNEATANNGHDGNNLVSPNPAGMQVNTVEAVNQFDRIPDEMKPYRQWVCWKREHREGGKPTKVPYKPNGYGKASVTNPEHWAGFDEAVAAFMAGGFDGIGFVFTDNDPFTGIDLDDAGEDAEAVAVQRRIYDAFDSYAELSPSGRGLHIIVKGKVASRRRGKVEVYSSGRYFTMTGRFVRPGSINDCQGLLERLSAELAPPAPETPTRASEGLSVGDSEVLASLMADPALAAVWNGDLSAHGGDHSAADQALCNALAPRTNFNPAQVERIWLASPLGQREKTQSRQDYRERTINKAMDSRPNFALVDSSKLTAEIAAKVEGNQPRFKLLTPDEVKLKPPMQWRVKGVFACNAVVVVYGASGTGKTFLLNDMACAIAEGEPWFGHRTKPAPVLYVSLEGQAGFAQRILAWEEAHGRPYPRDVRFLFQSFHLAHAEDVAALGSVCGYSEPVIIIDTLSQASPGLDENSSKDMGLIVEGAQKLQRLTGGLVILVHHTGKDETKGMRGNSKLFAALDASILVSRHGTRRTWKVDKAKDAEAGQEYGFVLKVCTVGRDEDGEGITSLVVEPDEVDASTPQQWPLTDNQKLGLSTIHTAAGECGQLVNNAFAGLHLNDWRPVFYRESTADNDEAKRKAFLRARADLVNRGELSVENDIYRLAGPNAAETEKVIAARLKQAGQRDIIGTSPGHVPRRDTP